MRPADFRHQVSCVRRSCTGLTADIRGQFEQFHDLAVETVIYYLGPEICDQPDIDTRRAIIDSIPDDCEPSHAKGQSRSTSGTVEEAQCSLMI